MIAGTEAPAQQAKATTAQPPSPSQEVVSPSAAATAAAAPAKRKVHIVLPEPSPRPAAGGGRGPGALATGPGKMPPRSDMMIAVFCSIESNDCRLECCPIGCKTYLLPTQKRIVGLQCWTGIATKLSGAKAKGNFTSLECTRYSCKCKGHKYRQGQFAFSPWCRPLNLFLTPLHTSKLPEVL